MSGLFAAVHEFVYRPFRRSPRRSEMSAFRVITEVATGCVKQRR